MAGEPYWAKKLFYEPGMGGKAPPKPQCLCSSGVHKSNAQYISQGPHAGAHKDTHNLITHEADVQLNICAASKLPDHYIYICSMQRGCSCRRGGRSCVDDASVGIADDRVSYTLCAGECLLFAQQAGLEHGHECRILLQELLQFRRVLK